MEKLLFCEWLKVAVRVTETYSIFVGHDHGIFEHRTISIETKKTNITSVSIYI